MRGLRLIAAIAAISTVLLVQATLIAPVLLPLPASLPVVFVAAVALVDGPGAGMALGFVAGLTADLGSDHPAGVLALTWLAVGVLAGMLAGRRSVWVDAALAGAVGALGCAVATVLLSVVHGAGATVGAVRDTIPAGLVELLLALVVVPVVRAALTSSVLRAPGPVLTDFALGQHRG